MKRGFKRGQHVVAAFERIVDELERVAEPLIGVGQIRLRPDQRNLGAVLQPGLADAGVEHRRLGPGIGADQEDCVRLVHAGNGGVEQVARAPVLRVQLGAELAAIVVRRAELAEQRLEREHLLDGAKVARDGADALAASLADAHGDFAEGVVPGDLFELAAHAHIRPVEPLALQRVNGGARLVRDPFLVHGVMVARQDAEHLAAAAVDADVGAKPVHHVDGLGLAQLPGPRGVGIGLRGQRANRAEIDHVARKLGHHALLKVGGDFHVLAAADQPKLRHARDLGHEADAARALDAARHEGLDERPEIFLFHGALGLAVAAAVLAIIEGLVLQVALAALVADGAVERMVDQQEFHHAFARLFDERRIRADRGRRAVAVRAQIVHARGAGRHRLRHAHDLDEAHAAIAGHRQALVVAEPRDFEPRQLARLQQRDAVLDLDFPAVNVELWH